MMHTQQKDHLCRKKDLNATLILTGIGRLQVMHVWYRCGQGFGGLP